MFPVIDVFVLAYNESEMIPHFLRHYAFARKIILLDNESTDSTVELAMRDSRVSVIQWTTGGKQDNLAMVHVKNNCWRKSDADYVVVCDMDEFVDCAPLESYGVCDVAFRCEGRMMVGVDGQPLEEIRRYLPAWQFNKTAVFSPRISDINFGYGAHRAAPQCPVVDGLLVLRHYLMLGEEYLLRRYRKYSSRMSQRDIQYGLGAQYLETDDQIRKVYRGTMIQSIESGYVEQSK
jgi:glycosyltransferase involved in cell wall biosynthesis